TSASAVGRFDLLRDHPPLAFAYGYLPTDDRIVRVVARCGYFRLAHWLRRFDAALHVCKCRAISFFVARLAAPRLLLSGSLPPTGTHVLVPKSCDEVVEF